MMRTLRTSAGVLAPLLAAVIELGLVCLVCGLGCCSFCFGPSVFPLSPLCCGVFPVFPPVHVFGGRRKGRYSFPLLSLVFLCPFVSCVLPVKYFYVDYECCSCFIESL